nr:hypothetical protein BaRGS_021894 [Batillaria attramentaria]
MRVIRANVLVWAAVQRSDSAFCGGVIIDALHVLTAAHCIAGVTVHPNYVSSSLVNDIAILTLSQPLDLSNPAIGAVCLPSFADDVSRGILVVPWFAWTTDGQNVSQCQYQCYRTYLQLYNYYCKWGNICMYTTYLAQFYMSCYGHCTCGLSRVGRIVGGTQAGECEFPWAVVINIGTAFCGGSILDSNTVLTAGHCVYSA